MKDHLEADELPKAGLRFFFPAGDNSDITKRVEWGAVALPPVPVLPGRPRPLRERAGRRALELGNELLRRLQGGARSSSASEHEVTVTRGRRASRRHARAGWWTPAGSPAADQAQAGAREGRGAHTINSAWFRLAGGHRHRGVGATTTTTGSGAWQERGMRKLSHQPPHGRGLLGLADPAGLGPISIGIVADPRFHPFDEIKTLDARDRLAAARTSRSSAARSTARRDEIEDFLKVENFAYSCERVFSPDRWALTGDRRRVRRPVLLAGLRLHRPGQHVHHRPRDAATSTARTIAPAARSSSTRST